VGPLGDRLKVRLTAPPVDGAANAQLLRFLAHELGVPTARVGLLAGHAGRDKQVEVRGPWRRPNWLPPDCA
jgi:hypothetical protein